MKIFCKLPLQNLMTYYPLFLFRKDFFIKPLRLLFIYNPLTATNNYESFLSNFLLIPKNSLKNCKRIMKNMTSLRKGWYYLQSVEEHENIVITESPWSFKRNADMKPQAGLPGSIVSRLSWETEVNTESIMTGCDRNDHWGRWMRRIYSNSICSINNNPSATDDTLVCDWTSVRLYYKGNIHFRITTKSWRNDSSLLLVKYGSLIYLICWKSQIVHLPFNTSCEVGRAVHTLRLPGIEPRLYF